MNWWQCKMNYYELIKQELINNEIYKKVKDYSKNRSDLKTYYNVGKMLSEAGKCYGEGIIKTFSKKLTSELGKGYSNRNLEYMRKFYLYLEKSQTVIANLTWSHYFQLLSLKNDDQINYYISLVIENNLSVRQLRNRIKLNDFIMDYCSDERIFKTTYGLVAM